MKRIGDINILNQIVYGIIWGSYTRLNYSDSESSVTQLYYSQYQALSRVVLPF